MKLNRIKDVLDEKGISQTWLAKQAQSTAKLVTGINQIWKRFWQSQRFYRWI